MLFRKDWSNVPIAGEIIYVYLAGSDTNQPLFKGELRTGFTGFLMKPGK